MVDNLAEVRPLGLAAKIEPSSTALLVVDVQNDFCHPDGFFGKSGLVEFSNLALAQRMREPLARLIDVARAADCLRVFIRGIYDPVYLSAPFAEKLAEIGCYRLACLEGTWGADYWDPIRLQRGPREVEVVKHRYSAFHDTDLVAILRGNGIRTVVVTGVATSGCVDSTARDALFHDFYVVVPSDATADYTIEKHQAHLAKLNSIFGSVVESARILEAWRGVLART